MTPLQRATAIVQQFLASETRDLNWSQMTPDEVEQEGGSYSELTAAHSVYADRLFEAFKVWVLESNVDQLPRETFDEAMDVIGYDYVRRDDGFVWYGRTRD